MAQALCLAERGRYGAHPNPVVGCVLVRDGTTIGEGWHVRAGEAHAEVNALQAAGELASGATAYVTLEPCAHTGKTPPCADALIDAGVERVVIAMGDPFPDVAGRGIERLRSAGIRVDTGLMSNAAAALNAGFLSRVTRQRPFVRLKLATSLDGAIAMSSGESQWITGPAARADVQRLRARSGAILTGIGTVLADDPSLTVRDESLGQTGQPLRVVLDTRLRMPATASMLSLPGSTLVCSSETQAETNLRAAGAEIATFTASDGRVPISGVLTELALREVNEVLVEAGPVLAGQMLQEGFVDELVIYQAPHIMGSETQPLAVTPKWTALADRRNMTIADTRRVGADTRITARPSQ